MVALAINEGEIRSQIH